MADGPVKSFLEKAGGCGVIFSRTLRVCGLGESFVEDQIRELMRGENPTVAPYAHPSEVHLRMTANAANRSEAERMLEPLEEQIRGILGNAVYGINETTLEDSVVAMLKDRNATVAVAESITGGWLGQRFTSVAGSGDVFIGGMITYDSGTKETFLGVRGSTLEQYGPVSEVTAQEMAVNVRELMKADYGISLTGNAGPTSDVDGKPVGLVYIGVAGRQNVKVEEHRLRGSRDDIRQRCTQLALVQLREMLLN
jgi:nicotinamide-nucleotide amidase